MVVASVAALLAGPPVVKLLLMADEITIREHLVSIINIYAPSPQASISTCIKKGSQESGEERRGM